MQYWTEPDADGDLTLWSGTGPGDPKCDNVAARYQLNAINPILWPILVAALVTGEPSETDVREVYEQDGKIPAIRWYREHCTGPTPGLRQAKEAVERICEATLTALDPEPPVGWRGIDADDQRWEHRAGGWHFWLPASPCPPECDEHDQWGPEGSIAYPIRPAAAKAGA